MPFSIELKKVTFGYKGPIVKDACLAAPPKSVTAIVAPVGAGKSTLLKIFAGLIRPDEGEVLFGGKNFWQLSTIEQNAIRRKMGFDFQEGALIANMTVFDNLALPLRYHGGLGEDKIKAAIDGWLETMELFSYRESLPAALSAGLKRRVSFIRAMLLGVDFFFWDEPTQGADSKFAQVVIDAVTAEKNSGAGVLVATQDRNLFEKTADYAIVLNKGATRLFGPLKGKAIPVEVSAVLRE